MRLFITLLLLLLMAPSNSGAQESQVVYFNCVKVPLQIRIDLSEYPESVSQSYWLSAQGEESRLIVNLKKEDTQVYTLSAPGLEDLVSKDSELILLNQIRALTFEILGYLAREKNRSGEAFSTREGFDAIQALASCDIQAEDALRGWLKNEASKEEI